MRVPTRAGRVVRAGRSGPGRAGPGRAGSLRAGSGGMWGSGLGDKGIGWVSVARARTPRLAALAPRAHASRKRHWRPGAHTRACARGRRRAHSPTRAHLVAARGARAGGEGRACLRTSRPCDRPERSEQFAPGKGPAAPPPCRSAACSPRIPGRAWVKERLPGQCPPSCTPHPSRPGPRPASPCAPAAPPPGAAAFRPRRPALQAAGCAPATRTRWPSLWTWQRRSWKQRKASRPTVRTAKPANTGAR